MKDIKNYEGLYAITEDGKVWSHRRKLFLKSNINKNGYEYVVFSVDGEKKTLTVHRLVAQAYIPNPDNKPEVNHKDEDKTNNHVDNLEWVDKKENVNYGSRNERAAKHISKAVYCEELDRVFDSLSQASVELHVCLSSISGCCKGKLKTAGNYHWRYVA